MPHFLRAKWLAAGCLALLPLLVATPAAGVPPDPVALDLDRKLQQLKDEAIRLNRDLQAAEQALQYPEQTRTSLYVAVKVGGFLLDEISVRINENEAVTRAYSASEARAFLRGEGWHRLLRLRLEPGTYRLQAEFTGHFSDAKAGEPPVKGKVETVFEKGLSELDLVLPISRNTRLDKPSLSEISRLESRKLRPSRNVWLPQPQRYESALAPDMRGTLNDPRYRSGLFLKEDGRYLSALTELLEIQASAPEPDALPLDFKLLMADCYLSFGMDEQAERLYRQIAAGEHDPMVLARAGLQLARFEYQRGYHDEALARLNQIREKLPSALLDDWRTLASNALMAQERFGEAVEVLSRNGDIEDLPPALRYNLAIALIREGRGAEGRRQLNLVGTMDVTSSDTLVLRDKANLTLGYQYLQAQKGDDARTVFGRIRTTGPFSNRALLGMGWAEVVPVTKQLKAELKEEAEGKDTDDSLGTLLRPGYVDPKARQRLDSKESKPAGGLSPEEQQALMRALIPWVELAKRDPMDAAVQEGMLAITWALDRLQDYEQSLTRYQEAIAALEHARKRMDDAARSIRGRRMVDTILRRDPDSERGWAWRLVDLPDAAETYFLQSLLAEHRFQEPLKNYRDAQLLARNLDAWKAQLEQLGQSAGGGASTLERQLQRAREGWQPTWAGTPAWLGFDTQLAPPGAYDAPLAAREAQAPLLLQALSPPAGFEGRREKLRPLLDRIEALRPRAREIASAHDELLKRTAQRELEGQKRTIERYLTEARFAVARIYDRQLRK